MKPLLLLALAAGASMPAAAQPTPRTEVMVLGVYHMANPGHDVFNMQADDVLAPKRQQEIAQLLEVLKKFHPTKIAIESEGARRTKQYADYLAGNYKLTANEIDQIGFRLAKELGHSAIYPVDADGDFPWQRVINYAKGSGRAKELDGLMSEIGDMVKGQDAYLASHTILETLLWMNADEKVAQDVGFYYREAHLGEPGDWAGADLIADWFRRNARIYSNVMHIVDSPNDRILVIFGAGHLGWLRHDFASDPTVRMRELVEFTSASETTMNSRTRAKSKITVHSSEANPFDQTGGPALVEVHLKETFTGDLDGESPVRALQVLRDDHSASLVSVQRFRGKLGGRQGTFVLQGQEIVENGKIKATWFVVPGSGTGALTGLRGEGGFEGDFGKGSDGTLDYWFE